MNDPTHCDRCKSNLSRGWSERWSGDAPQSLTRVECVCFACDNAEKLDTYAKTGLLSIGLVCAATAKEARGESDDTLARVSKEYAEVRDACKAFERDVWFAGFQSTVRAASRRGFRALFAVGPLSCVALAYSLAGRVMLTLRAADDSCEVSLITAEDESEPVMGVASICATKEQAVGLIDAATRQLAAGNGFSRDDKCGVF